MTEHRADYQAGNQPEITWTPIAVKLSDLEPWKDNPKTLTRAEAKRLLHSTDKLGRMQSISIGPRQANGLYPLYDGHQRAYLWATARGADLVVAALQSSRALTEDERRMAATLTLTARGELNFDMLANWNIPNWEDYGLGLDTLLEWKAEYSGLLALRGSINPEDEWGGMPEFENESKAIKTLAIHFETIEDFENFIDFIEQPITDKTRSIWYPEKKKIKHPERFENES